MGGNEGKWMEGLKPPTLHGFKPDCTALFSDVFVAERFVDTEFLDIRMQLH